MKLSTLLARWQNENKYIKITIKDLEVNPYLLKPNDEIMILEEGLMFQDTFYNWNMVRSIELGGNV